MKISRSERYTKKLEAFMWRGWKSVHMEHYGEELELSYWQPKHLYLEVKEGDELVGGLIGEFYGGVLFLSELMVSLDYRGKGVGEKLIKEAEAWARDQEGHEAFLFVGKDWKAKLFYSKAGYEMITEIDKHYGKVDFVLMRKLLD